MSQKHTIEADLIADTRDSEQRLGFRGMAAAERRILYKIPDAYIELRMPPMMDDEDEAAWLYGQFILPEQSKERYPKPIFATLHNEEGVTGAVRTTEMGDFALPFSGKGEFMVDIEAGGDAPCVRARFDR